MSAPLEIRVQVPLGDARARLRGEVPGTWRTVWRRVYGVRGAVGRRTGEVFWRRFPYPVRERGPGRWALGLYDFPLSEQRLIRVPPPPGRVRGIWRALTFYPIRRRVGVRRNVLGYAVFRGSMHRVGQGVYGLELLPRRGR